MSKASELANLIGNINAGGGGVNRNLVINGAMNVAQRATSSTGIGASSGYFTCDRWKITTGNTAGELTMTQDSSAPSGTGLANSIKLDCTNADGSIAADEITIIGQSIEGQNLQTIKKGTSSATPITVSFYAKANATATYVAELFDHDNTRNNTRAFTVGTDWARVELTFIPDTTGTLDDDNAASLTFQIWLHAGATYSGGTFSDNTWQSVTQANRYAGSRTSFFSSVDRELFLTGLQLEVGQNPTEFEHEPFERTLAKCQRYYQSIKTNDGAPNYNGHVNAAAGSIIVVPFIQQMRTAPTGITVTNVGSWGHVIYGDTNIAANSITIGNASSKEIQLDVNSASGSFSVGEAISLYDNGSNGVIEFTGAEL